MFSIVLAVSHVSAGQALKADLRKHGVEMGTITIYSPAPPSNMLHTLNLELLDAAGQCEQLPPLQVVAVALPDSINDINRMPPTESKRHLPIVTTVDLLPARNKTGVSWHAYDRDNQDLKLVTTLYDIGFGLLSFDPSISSPSDLAGKRVGVPPRPSSIRVLSEALLRDGWGILDKVELVDLTPAEVNKALNSGLIDATTWNLVRREAKGYATLLPALLSHPNARWMQVDADVISKINENNPFILDMTTMSVKAVNGAGKAENINLLSFAQALAAWDSTDEKTVKGLLNCIVSVAGRYEGLPKDTKAMLDWPGLTRKHLHPAAADFYRDYGVAID